MCELKSALVLKDRVFMPLDYDSHEEMIKELKLNDKTKNPDFVRVEIVPPNKDFTKPLGEWIYKVDQDYLPEWYSAKFAEKETREELIKWYEQRVIISGNIEQITSGRWFLGGSANVEYIGGSAQVKNICGSAQVENICGSAQVESICDSAQVESIFGRSVACFTGKKAKYKEIKENGIAILYYKENPEIIVANKKIKLTYHKQESEE